MGLQDVLSQTIPVPRRSRGVILGAIALDSQHETTGFLRIRHGQIDEEAGGSNLDLHVVAERRDSRGDLRLKDRIGVSAGLLCHT